MNKKFKILLEKNGEIGDSQNLLANQFELKIGESQNQLESKIGESQNLLANQLIEEIGQSQKLLANQLKEEIGESQKLKMGLGEIGEGQEWLKITVGENFNEMEERVGTMSQRRRQFWKIKQVQRWAQRIGGEDIFQTADKWCTDAVYDLLMSKRETRIDM